MDFQILPNNTGFPFNIFILEFKIETGHQLLFEVISYVRDWKHFMTFDLKKFCLDVIDDVLVWEIDNTTFLTMNYFSYIDEHSMIFFVCMKYVVHGQS